MTKSVTLFVRVNPQLAARLDAVVAASIGDRSDHIRAAISEYITRHEPALQAPAPAPKHPAS